MAHHLTNLPADILPVETCLVDAVCVKLNATGPIRVARKSPRMYDLRFEGSGSFDSPTKKGEAVPYKFGAWLPLAAIRELVNWTSMEVALMTAYPEMVIEGDWSGVRDSEPERIWAIFERFVLGKLNAAIQGGYLGPVLEGRVAR